MEMISNVVSFPQLPEASQAKPVAPVAAQVAAPASGNSTGNSTSDSTQNDDTGGASTGGQKTPYYQLRLTIDKNPTTGGWVYKAIDRTTGKVVSELPQESAMQMQESEDYQAGSIINSEA
jgi:flagellar protein FlaG